MSDLAAHLAWAADDICAAFAADFATLEADKAVERSKEAVLRCPTTTDTHRAGLLGLLLGGCLGRRRRRKHLDASSGLFAGRSTGNVSVWGHFSDESLTTSEIRSKSDELGARLRDRGGKNETGMLSSDLHLL